MRISLSRKIALWGVLYLGIFTAITAIIRAADGILNNGWVDATWVIFWLQMEAAVAVIVVSFSAFRALFVAHRPSKQEQLPAPDASKSRLVWSKRLSFQDALPAIPPATFTGIRTFIRRNHNDEETQDMEFSQQGSGIRVTQDISSESVRCVIMAIRKEADLP